MSVCNVFCLYGMATTYIYTLSLHDALPISWLRSRAASFGASAGRCATKCLSCERAPGAGDRSGDRVGAPARSEEHTSELQSLAYLVCRLLLEKKKLNVINTLAHRPVTHAVS